MPTMNGKKYPYTKEGMRRYKQEEKKSSPRKREEYDKKSLAQDTTKSPYMIKDGKMVLRPEYRDGKKSDNAKKDKAKKPQVKGMMPKSSKTANKEAKAKMKQARKYLKKKDG